MRTKLLPLLALVLGVSCATTPDGQQDITPAIRAGAYMGTAYALLEHPERRGQFEQAAIDLRVIEEAPTISLGDVLLIVNRLVNDDPRSKSAILLNGAIVLLADYGGTLPPDQMDKLRPYVKAMRDGIELGLGPAPATLGKATI